MNGALVMAAVGLVWIASDDGRTLKASGYPISIERGQSVGAAPYRLLRDGTGYAYWSLANAKIYAEKMAREIDEFAPNWKP